MHVDYSTMSSLKERKGSKFKVRMSVRARTTYPHFFRPQDLLESASISEGPRLEVWEASSFFAPLPRGDAYDHIDLVTQCHALFWSKIDRLKNHQKRRFRRKMQIKSSSQNAE